MRNNLTKIALLVSFFAFGFLQGCEDKEEIAKEEIARNKAREERRQVREQERQQQAAELEKLKTELDAQKKEIAAAKANREAAQIRAKNVQAVANSPDKYINGSECTHNDATVKNGTIFVNKTYYTSVQACKFTNSSDFSVSNISGNLIITAQNGTKIVPFKTTGSLGAKQTNMLPVTGIQQLQIPGNPLGFRVEILKADVNSSTNNKGNLQ